MNFVTSINNCNKKGIHELKLNNIKQAEKHFLEAEVLQTNFRKFWYLNQKELGDLLECNHAYKCITLTMNNLGLMYKKLGRLNISVKYFKQILQIEEAVMDDL